MGLTPAQSANLQPELVTRFNQVIDACAAKGVTIVIHSTYRSTARQTQLYLNRFRNPNPVAKPGFSPHEWGVAIDATPAPRTANNWKILWKAARTAGLHLGEDFTTKVDPPHFELVGFVHGATQQIWPKPTEVPAPFKPYPGNVTAQPHLIRLGYLTAAQAAGGDGPKTRAAIQKFQADQVLKVDGKAGPKTMAALLAA